MLENNHSSWLQDCTCNPYLYFVSGVVKVVVGNVVVAEAWSVTLVPRMYMLAGVTGEV